LKINLKTLMQFTNKILFNLIFFLKIRCGFYMHVAYIRVKMVNHWDEDPEHPRMARLTASEGFKNGQISLILHMSGR
jgi:hypothetical protein